MKALGAGHKAGVDCIYTHYERYCKSLGLTAASQDDYENAVERFFRQPKKYNSPWDEHNSLSVLMWPKEVPDPEKPKKDETKLERKNRTGLNRAFRDVHTDSIVKPRSFRHRHLMNSEPQSGFDYEVARKRGCDPNTPFVLEEINHWLLSLDKAGVRPMMTGQGSFWDGWDCDAWLTQEYGDTYSTFLASEHRVVSNRLPWLSTPREKWNAEYRHRRVWRLFRTEKTLERRIFDSVREHLWPRPVPFVFWNGALLSQKRQRTELVTRYRPNVVPMASCSGKVSLMSEQLYRGSEFAAYQSVKLAYRDLHIFSKPCKRTMELIPAYAIAHRQQRLTRLLIKAVWEGIGDANRNEIPAVTVLTLRQPVIVPDDTCLPVYAEVPLKPYRREHKFLDALAPAFPTTKDGVYLTLQKRGRNGSGEMKNLGQLYIGRVIDRARTKDETTKQWTDLSMRLAERFVVKRMRQATKAGALQDWLAWTERYYALKSNPLPDIPDGLEASAWERDAEGKFVNQLLGDVSEHVTPAVSIVDGNDDMESWTPPETWRGQ